MFTDKQWSRHAKLLKELKAITEQIKRKLNESKHFHQKDPFGPKENGNG